MEQKDGQGAALENVASEAAKHGFAQAAVTISPHDEEIGPQGVRAVENGSRGATIGVDGLA